MGQLREGRLLTSALTLFPRCNKRANVATVLHDFITRFEIDKNFSVITFSTSLATDSKLEKTGYRSNHDAGFLQEFTVIPIAFIAWVKKKRVTEYRFGLLRCLI